MFLQAVLAGLIMQWFNSTSTKSSELFSTSFQGFLNSFWVNPGRWRSRRESFFAFNGLAEWETDLLPDFPTLRPGEKKMFQSEWVGGDCRWTGTSCECFLGDFAKFPIWTVQGVGLVSDMMYFFFTCICRVGLKSSWEVSSRAKSIILLYKRMRGTYVGYQKLKSSMT